MKRKEYYHDRPDGKSPIKLRRFCVQKCWEQYVFPSINFTCSKWMAVFTRPGIRFYHWSVNTEIRNKKFSCLVCFEIHIRLVKLNHNPCHIRITLTCMSLLVKTFSSVLQEGFLPGRTRKNTNEHWSEKCFSRLGNTNVVVFVFEPRKFDDLPFPLRVNSLTFRWLKSSFLWTFALYCKFSIDQDNFRSKILAGGMNVRSKSPR